MDEGMAVALLDAAPVGLLVIDPAGTISWASPSVYDLTGYGHEDVVGTNILTYLHETAVDGLLESVSYVTEYTDAVMGPASLGFVHADGELRVLEVYGTNRLDDPLVGGLVVSVRDITFQYRINEALQAYTEGAALERVLHILAGALLGLPIQGRSSIFDTVTGEPLAEIGLHLMDLASSPPGAVRRPWEEAVVTGEPVYPADLSAYDDELRRHAAEHGIATIWAVPVAIAAADIPLRPRACVVIAKSGPGEPSVNERYTIANLTRSAALVMEREVLLGELARSARSDPLTGLANRAHLFRSRAGDRSGDHRGDGPVAVLAVDLDGFKPINDAHGHAAGDAVLVEVARRMAAACRAGDELGRIGGDEFVMLCWNITDDREATAVADRILSVLAAPIDLPPGLGADFVSVGASIGIALSAGADARAEGEGLDRTLARADGALYDAKRSGRNRWSLAAR
jgi:diguanylate cyclase (GGDEF)-like protein/PAS domain S-box-containing protein